MTKDLFRHNLCFAALSVLLLLVAPLRAQVVQNNPQDLQKIDVVEHQGDTIPMDLHFVNEQGESVTLGDYFHKGRPVLLILGYYRCPMLCNLVFNGVADAVKGINLEPYRDYQIVTVSINEEETPELAQAKKANYLKDLSNPGFQQGWVFLTGAADQSRKLADAIGFKYFPLKEKGEFAHPAVITLLSDDGMVSRYLYGVKFASKDLRLGLLEAGDGKVGTTLDRIILYCYHYDPDSGSYTVFATNVMKLGGLACLLLVGGFVGLFWVRERRRSRRKREKQPLERVGI